MSGPGASPRFLWRRRQGKAIKRSESNMERAQEIERLTECFRALGAPEPESWARSQVEEGIPQYARFVFLRAAWSRIIADGDTSWIEPTIADSARRPRDPGSSAGPILERMLTAGISRDDITELARVMQWAVLFDLSYQLSDPGVTIYPDGVPHVDWTLFEVDEDGNPLHPIDGLHESVLDTDPSGREMRPRGVGREG